MPFYEYECQACKYYVEVMQKISDPPLLRCPSCGKQKMQKLVSAPVFRLKGSGWYETDFKSDKEGRRNLIGPEKDESKPDAVAKDTKDAKDSKDVKDTKDAKPAAAEKKESKDSKNTAAAARKPRPSVTVPARAARSSRKSARPKRKNATRRRR